MGWAKLMKRLWVFPTYIIISTTQVFGQVAEPVFSGDYRDIAACVFKQLDPMSPGNFRLTTLPNEIVITFETTGGGMTFRDLKATFTAVGRNQTSIDIEGRPPGYYPSKVRPLASACAEAGIKQR